MFKDGTRHSSKALLKQLSFTVSPPAGCRRFSGPAHFYSNKQLELYAARKANRLSLRQLVFFGRSMDEERLIKSANYVRTELPVRISHRIRDMQNLPYVVVSEEHVSQVYELYWEAFEKLRHYPQINTRKDNDQFCVFLRSILNEHAAVIPILSLGLSISSPHLSSDELDSFMRRMLVSRISRRVLAEHHLALSQGLAEQEQSKGEHGNVGIIFPNLNVKRSVDKFIRLLLSEDSFSDPLRQHSPLQSLKELPKIIIDGETDATFPYIREHLEYIILELLLNAVYSTALQLQKAPDKVPGVIHATISSNADEVYVRISDQGGGLMLLESQIPSDLFSFSHHRNTTRMSDDRIDALQHLSRRKEGLMGKVSERLLPKSEDSSLALQKDSQKPTTQRQRMGLGLPLSNIYATYFGGTLKLVSMDGWGTDVYLTLPRLGTNLEGIEV
ncbi:alpha-ketoacid dehydrogenase kinase [Serendipita vermifera]|nr:alpha-ketoacid dehydrogenase kinase [Serendipita vermifera]